MSKELEDRIAKLEGDLAASQAETAKVKSDLETEIAKNKTLEASQAEIAKKVRQDKITALFSLTGEEMTEESAKPYFSMTDEVFSVVVEQAKKLMGKRVPDGLFSESATNGKPQETKNGLLDDASRRAEAFEKAR